MRRAFRELPWFIAGTFLLWPLLLAPFTGGSSLFAYVMIPSGMFADSWETARLAIAALLGPGILLWVIFNFFRLFRSHGPYSRPSDKY